MTALVLVVDDDPDARNMLAQAFAGAGYATLLAADGQKALDLASATAPDLIVLDAVMDGLSGFETCLQLKQLPSLAETPQLTPTTVPGMAMKFRFTIASSAVGCGTTGGIFSTARCRSGIAILSA